MNFEFAQLLHPAQAFGHPFEVVNDPDLTLNEKRAILASWASDACAIEAAPELRAGTKAPVRYDDIMDALHSLDNQANGGRYRSPFGRRFKGAARETTTIKPSASVGAAMRSERFIIARERNACAWTSGVNRTRRRPSFPALPHCGSSSRHRTILFQSMPIKRRVLAVRHGSLHTAPD